MFFVTEDVYNSRKLANIYLLHYYYLYDDEDDEESPFIVSCYC